MRGKRADTFDCVAPTREICAWSLFIGKHGYINIKKFEGSQEVLDPHCDCPVCKAGWTRDQLRSLLKSKNPDDRAKYFNLASIHNLRFTIRLTEEIRQAIIDGRFEEYKDEFMKNYYSYAKNGAADPNRHN